MFVSRGKNQINESPKAEPKRSEGRSIARRVAPLIAKQLEHQLAILAPMLRRITKQQDAIQIAEPAASVLIVFHGATSHDERTRLASSPLDRATFTILEYRCTSA